MARWSLRSICVALLLFLMTATATAQAESLADQMRKFAEQAHSASLEKSADAATLQSRYIATEKSWQAIEEGIRKANPTFYLKIEQALDEVKDAATASNPNPDTIRHAFDELADVSTAASTALEKGGGEATTQATIQPAQVLSILDEAYTAAENGDAATAQKEFGEVVEAWPAIEGNVATHSKAAYETIEDQLGRTQAALAATPPDLATAERSIDQIRIALRPFTEQQTYTAIDAAAIILREGLEALLVIAALLSFLQRSGNTEKRIWIWVGGAAGIVCSILLAFALQAIFSQATAGQSRELIEGITGLIAAFLLFYVSYWLHSKASIGAWQSYIKAQTTQAIAKGSMVGLALLAFLSVLREGAETTIFYLGMAPSISINELLLGLAIGVVALIILAALILGLGVRLPMRLFFQVAGLLVYYLGFKFVGAGLHSFQVAGMLPITPIALIPSIPSLGIFPTLQTLIPQLLMLCVAVAVVFYFRLRDQQLLRTQQVAS